MEARLISIARTYHHKGLDAVMSTYTISAIEEPLVPATANIRDPKTHSSVHIRQVCVNAVFF